MNQITSSALIEFPRVLEQYFAAIPTEFHNWIPRSWEGVPSESLTAISQICHVRDVEIDGYHARIRKMLSEPQPQLESLDGYALVTDRAYAKADPVDVFEKFRAARESTLLLVRNLTSEELDRSGNLEGYGVATIGSLMHYLCSHDQQHLAGLQWLMGKIASEGTAVLASKWIDPSEFA